MLTGPWIQLFGRPTERHPLHVISSSSQQQIDFWGPCLVYSLFGLVLWLAHVKDVPWSYIIWSLAALFNHLVCRVWLSSSKLMLHVALLGYSVAPVIPFAAIIVIVRPSIFLTCFIELVAVTWASSSAILSYRLICTGPTDKKHRLGLLVPSIVLMHLYIVSLIPIRR